MKQILLLFFLCFAASSFAEDNVERTYYDTGEIQCEFPQKNKNNLLDGLLKCYHKNGTLRNIVTIRNGKVEGIEKVYDENKILRQETPYNNSKIEGVLKVYYPSGALAQEAIYKNNKREGITTVYEEDGAIKQTTNYKNDVKNGTETLYIDSTLFAYIIYENNKAISGKCADGRVLNSAEITNFNNGISIKCRVKKYY